MSISVSELLRALALRDLTDPEHGPHAMQILVAAITQSLPVPVHVHRASPVVSVEDNYDHLGYPPDGAAREARYTRYVCDTALLRTQTSAMIPPLLRRRASEPPAEPDVVLACPGLVYRRDVIDRLHVGEPHQLDLWRIARDRALDARDLESMIAAVVDAALPGAAYRTVPAAHPYTEQGRQIDVRVDDEWIEVGECGLASPSLLARCGLAGHRGLAMGLGLDRLLMLRKGIPDIRLLRATDPRIASQMLDLAPYRAVSTMPPVRRDLSLAMARPPDVELLGDRVRSILGQRADLLECVDIVAVTPYDELPAAAIARIGLAPRHSNVLVRLTLRALDRTLTHEECNALRDDVYAALHEGSVYQWASALPRGQPPRPTCD